MTEISKFNSKSLSIDARKTSSSFTDFVLAVGVHTFHFVLATKILSVLKVMFLVVKALQLAILSRAFYDMKFIISQR